MKIQILYEDNHLLVVVKPVNVPVQLDISGDDSVLDMLKQYIKEKYQKSGNVYLGLVHRLDRPVGGVMVFAKTSKAASRLSEQVRNHSLKKEYHAVVVGNINNKGNYFDRLLKDERNNKVSVNPKGKEAKLSYEKVSYKNGLSLVKINLETGRSHQIRVQFSYHGYPLYGDQKYNESANVGEQIALFATSLSFIHPVTKEQLTFSISYPNKYPWNIFNT